MKSKSRLVCRILAAAIAAFTLGEILFPIPAAGQVAPQPPAPGAPAPGPGAAPEFKWPDFQGVIKDMDAIPSPGPGSGPGIVTLYRYKADDPTKDQTKLLCEVPKSLLKQDLLLVSSFSRGSQAGMPGMGDLIRFEMLGRQIVIVAPDTRFVQTPGQTATDVINRTYNGEYLASMPIVTMSPGGNPVVDLGPTLMSGMGMNIPAGIRRELSQFTKIKSFQENVLIDVDLVVAGRGGSSQSTGITYDIRRLPDAKAYTPRLADERIGYFDTVRQDWNIKHNQRENVVRYIDRWDVKKKDPSLDVSPPEKPIVFIIEKTVPLQWRRYVAEGIAEWNKAFEKIGISGAIVVQQQTDDNEYANFDPEDARYNFIRWIVTGRAFAMGPHHSDPRTGQILDADIVFDDSMLRYNFNEFEMFGPKAMSAMLGPEYSRFLIENPAFIPMGHTIDEVQATLATPGSDLFGDSPADNITPTLRAHHMGSRYSQPCCEYASGMKQELNMASLAMAAAGMKLPEPFIGEVIREIVAHEVGHTLGLRHNFKASAWLSLDEVKRRRDTTDEALVASVMDYAPTLFFPGDDFSKVRHFITPTIGPYDYLAIEYGYKVPGKDDGDEKTMINKIASMGTKPELPTQPMKTRWASHPPIRPSTGLI